MLIYGIKLNNLGGCLKGKGNDGSHESVTCSPPHISNINYMHFEILHNSLAPQLNFMLVRNHNDRQGFRKILPLKHIPLFKSRTFE